MDEVKRLRTLFNEARRLVWNLGQIGVVRFPDATGFLDGYDDKTREDICSRDPKLGHIYAMSMRRAARRRRAYVKARFPTGWQFHERHFACDSRWPVR